MCLLGTYQETDGAIVCTPADIGYYVSLPGQTSQQICPEFTSTELTLSTSAASCEADFDGDGVIDRIDLDDDDDGFDDIGDALPYNANEWYDNDGDGVGDKADEDDDNDGVLDVDDPYPMLANVTRDDFSIEEKNSNSETQLVVVVGLVGFFLLGIIALTNNKKDESVVEESPQPEEPVQTEVPDEKTKRKCSVCGIAGHNKATCEANAKLLPKKKPKRARNKGGDLIEDDPSTPDYNEAWEGGVAPEGEDI